MDLFAPFQKLSKTEEKQEVEEKKVCLRHYGCRFSYKSELITDGKRILLDSKTQHFASNKAIKNDE